MPSAPQQLITLPSGSMHTDVSVNSSLRSSLREVRLSDGTYAVPNVLDGLLSSVVAEALERDPNLFNGECVRLCSDMDGNDPFIIQRAHYFDGLCSNRLSRLDKTDPIRRLLDDGQDNLVPFSRSVLANIVGTSTLAITRDEKMVIPIQGRTVSSPGLCAPSGSGSLDIGDVIEDLGSFINGAVREMREECGLTDDAVLSSQLSGMGRWVEHGGKPEFSSLTFLKVSSDDVSSFTADAWTHKVISAPFRVPADLHDSWAYSGSVATLVSMGEIPEELVSLPLEFTVRAAVAVMLES